MATFPSTTSVEMSSSPERASSRRPLDPHAGHNRVVAADQPVHRVLIVDDHPEVRALLRARLDIEPGIDVVGEASTGAEAVRLTRLLSPSAVILDLEMPVMTGPAAIPLMRESAPGMGILLYTANEDVSLPEEQAPDRIVRKGVSLTVVVETLRELLAQTPFEILRLVLGPVPLRAAVTAFDTWTGLHVRVLHALRRNVDLLESQLGGATAAELEALTSVFAHVGYNLQQAARSGTDHVDLVLHIFRANGALARRALLAFNSDRIQEFWTAWGYEVHDDALEALALMRERLMEVLPASSGEVSS